MSNPDQIHLHLDPVGGLAGDMFAAALLDARPELEGRLMDALNTAGFNQLVHITRHDHNDGILTGSRVSVEPVAAAADTPTQPEAAAMFIPVAGKSRLSPTDHHHGASHAHGHDQEHGHAHTHRSWKDVRALLNAARLDNSVRDRALDIFRHLAKAEARVHGVEIDAVSFHEVGAWDSIADIVMAAWLLDALDVATTSCSALPLGRGRVETAHGSLPVPAPATTLLLDGMPMIDDGFAGERITPTGAAILRHLNPRFDPEEQIRILESTGTGFGTKTMSGISNTVRALLMRTTMRTADVADLQRETAGLINFEIDDQTAEDLAVALDKIRAVDGVLDISQSFSIGKKGRMTSSIQIICKPLARDLVEHACLTETTTLGVRWSTTERTVLKRAEQMRTIDGKRVRVKHATRPRGDTRKVDIDDIADAGDHQARQTLRHRVENLAADKDPVTDRGASDE